MVKPHQMACTFTSGCFPEHMKNGLVEHTGLRRAKEAASSITVSRQLTLRLLFLHWHFLASGVKKHTLGATRETNAPPTKLLLFLFTVIANSFQKVSRWMKYSYWHLSYRNAVRFSYWQNPFKCRATIDSSLIHILKAGSRSLLCFL